MQKERAWDEGEPPSAGVGTGHYAGGVERRGRGERPLTASALHSYLKRLEEKGFLACEKTGKVNSYRPLVSRREYERREGMSVLSKLYAGSLKRFAAALYDGGALSPGDVEELKDYLDHLKEE